MEKKITALCVQAHLGDNARRSNRTAVLAQRDLFDTRREHLKDARGSTSTTRGSRVTTCVLFLGANRRPVRPLRVLQKTLLLPGQASKVHSAKSKTTWSSVWGCWTIPDLVYIRTLWCLRSRGDETTKDLGLICQIRGGFLSTGSDSQHGRVSPEHSNLPCQKNKSSASLDKTHEGQISR